MAKDLKQRALNYHRRPTPGKLQVVATKPLGGQHDLSLAYSPGVGAACEAIVADPAEASTLTARANLVGVVTNGTAVLGLGNIGPLAAKPVMEGKAVLFKKFAGIDVFDIELDAADPDRFCDIVAGLEPTFGAINLEDIKAPECFQIEARLRERMNIPVFHDDQHGTAIIVAAAIRNGLDVVGKKIEDVKLVTAGAGAAAIACLDMLVKIGLRVENIIATDLHGVLWEGRPQPLDARQQVYVKDTDKRTLADAIAGADVFLGLSAPGVLKPEMLAEMAERPLVMALANPVPEILPDEVRAVRHDAVIATGRSDFPNQVNNVLCFPFIFRGALDVGATTINDAMEIACVEALAALARAELSEVVVAAYGGQVPSYGPEYLIPKPFDPRLISTIAPAVARAAMDSGVATRPIEEFPAYVERLEQFVFRSGLVMKPVFDAAKRDLRRVVFAEGEEERVLRAVQVVLDEAIAIPILIGRPKVIDRRLVKLGLRIRAGTDFEVIDPTSDKRYREYWSAYHDIMARSGVSPDEARRVVRTNTTVIGSLMVRKGAADSMICGTVGRYARHLEHVLDIVGIANGARDVSALHALVLDKGTYFLCDTQVSQDPTVEELVEMTLLAAEQVRRFGIEPKVALVSHSNFGSSNHPQSRKMRDAVAAIRERAPDLAIEGEMHADAALSETIRARIFPNSTLDGAANLLVMPSLDAANIAFNLVKLLGDGIAVGPMLIGAAASAHILTPSVTVRGITNMTALAAVDAQNRAADVG
ncbi:MAG: NADP-dependent malic enzyme [Pseudomonadota bacterium]